MKNNLFGKLMRLSQLTMMISLIGFIICLFITYLWDHQFSINQQVLAHILTIIFAAFFKVAVVVLMAVSKEQNAQNLEFKREALCYNPKF